MNVFSTYSVYVSPLLSCYFRILFVFSLYFIIIPILIIICLTFSFFNSQLMHVYLLGWFLQYRQHPPLYWRGVSSRVRFAGRGNAVRSQSPCSCWKTYEDPDVVPQPLRFIPKRTKGFRLLEDKDNFSTSLFLPISCPGASFLPSQPIFT